jgi:hypothetical protein
MRSQNALGIKPLFFPKIGIPFSKIKAFEH